MSSVCETITAQMDEIAALVSDPVILRKRPELVIKNFAAAVKKVEMQVEISFSKARLRISAFVKIAIPHHILKPN